MPFNQNGQNPNANFGTYNDVAGNQHNVKNNAPTHSTVQTGDITAGQGGSGHQGTGGQGGSVNVGRP